MTAPIPSQEQTAVADTPVIIHESFTEYLTKS